MGPLPIFKFARTGEKMKPFEYFAPKSLNEAVSIFDDAKKVGDTRGLIGGSDLIDQVRNGRREPQRVVNLKGIPETNRIEWIEGDGLHLGSAVSCTDTAHFSKIKERYYGLFQACQLVGSVQIQNRASVAGNVCNSTPSADTVPSLLTYNAKALLVSSKGERIVDLSEFFTGPGRNIMEANEFLVEIILPDLGTNTYSRYQRFIPRNEMDIAVVGVASFVKLDDKKNCLSSGISLASVAATPVNAKDAAEFLIDKEFNKESIEGASNLAPNSATPISDVRGTSEYRKKLVRVLTNRTLNECLQDSL
jgi:xanthine dehydrogenase FAD-binding subunit